MELENENKAKRASRRRTTMHDIARLAEVDVSTVSRALADSPRVTEETKRRILKIVQDTGYVVNHGARMLRQSYSGQVLVMLPSIAFTYFPEVVLGIEDYVQERGFSVVVGSTRYDRGREDALAQQLLTGAADGIIFMTGMIPELIRTFPGFDRHVVGISRTILDDRIPQVNIDNYLAMKTATEHLLSLGHKSIAHLAGNQRSPTFRARAEAYQESMGDAGLGRYIKIVASDEYSIQAGTDKMNELLQEGTRPTAVICAGDDMAIGAMHAARLGGLAIPGDVAFVGFDDQPFSAVWNPSLSTIQIPRREMGMAGARLLLANMNLANDKPESIVLPHKLIVRESCGG
ncbi:LacI family DNA-binding transcriptional regulator [Mesorhizobium sp. M2A.F.Ca.ET.039.01.1.1]|uniref:LacI family DNA-binding transcriptional regulator n=1 Tax=Mesorhizobium sp. M2A.F.Ca.ET.039.01.1.1 TaxID=2496746 RepID=UPI000FCC6EBC|nr:LacI family DNA-binding transcriptional regulator [Mesorhizobium sp. M2A.F.Ca.ET.039.01.1.1]RWX69408.1 LacI family DNA-binding transcriptional regulator [Mesorhizobium sp. M2A.F.Ca.ET.039.01.1.1]